MVLEIIRIVFGFAFVLLLPGLALTSALWPKTKKMVLSEVLDILKEKGAGDTAIVGSSDDTEDIADFLEKNSIKINKDSKFVVLVGELEEGEQEIDKGGRTIIDLGNNVDGAIKVEDTIDIIERIALSIGLSVAIAPLVGLVLNYTPFGITFESIFASLSLVIIGLFSIYYKRIQSWNTSKSLS
ncbi:DUF1616 domain-containing protein [archaeon]|nr:DUF1616 domain-containing protein [archaeon]